MQFKDNNIFLKFPYCVCCFFLCFFLPLWLVLSNLWKCSMHFYVTFVFLSRYVWLFQPQPPPPKPLPPDPENLFVLVPLHEYPEFTIQCATLLNMEWPRSRQARFVSCIISIWSQLSLFSPRYLCVCYILVLYQLLHLFCILYLFLRLNSLLSCSHTFPVGMVLVESDSRQAIGFCKVSLIPNVKDACFVESGKFSVLKCVCDHVKLMSYWIVGVSSYYSS